MSVPYCIPNSSHSGWCGSILGKYLLNGRKEERKGGQKERKKKNSSNLSSELIIKYINI